MSTLIVTSVNSAALSPKTWCYSGWSPKYILIPQKVIPFFTIGQIESIEIHWTLSTCTILAILPSFYTPI